MQRRLAAEGSSFQAIKDQLRRDGIESYGTIPASYYNGGNAENPVSSITNGNCTGTCATTLAANPNARGVNSLSVSYFEQERVRDSYTAAVQWRPTDALELNFYQLATDPLVDGQEIEERIRETVESVARSVRERSDRTQNQHDLRHPHTPFRRAGSNAVGSHRRRRGVALHRSSQACVRDCR